MENNNSNPPTVVHNQEVCTNANMAKDSTQMQFQVVEKQCFVDSNKDMELYLKLHIANHKPG